MDFKNIPNTSSYPIAQPSPDQFGGGVSSGAMDPQAYAGATLNTDTGDPPKKSNVGVYMGIFAAFAVMTASSIGFFMYLSNNGQSTRASSNDNQYSALLSQTPVPAKPTNPAPTIDLGTFAVTLTPSPAPVITVFPTLPNNVATYTPTPAVTITPIRGNKWAISFSKMTYTPKDLPGVAPSAVGTLYTPIEYGKLFCTDTSNTFFTWKKNNSTIERLCDRLTPTTTEPQLICNNSTPSGVSISAKLLPTTNCANSGSTAPPTGTYVMYTKIYYDCSTSSPTQSKDTCKSVKEIFSDDFNFSKN
jgi:hypothetical protein